MKTAGKSLILFSAILVLSIAVCLSQAFAGAPRISAVVFSPERPNSGTPLKLKIKLDDGAIRAEVKWTVNGQEVKKSDFDGIAPFVEFQEKIKADDVVEAAVTPFDHYGAEGLTVTKSVVIADSPPTMKLMDEKIDGGNYLAVIEFSDPDGGPVTLSVKEGPPGLAIDEKGKITWKLKPGISGSFPVIISGKDEKGSEAILSYSIVLRWEKGKTGH